MLWGASDGNDSARPAGPRGGSCGGPRRPRLGYPLFDVDVHTSFRRAADLVPYLPQRYRQRFQESGVGDSPATFLSGAGGNREDAVAPDGSPAGTSAPFVAQQLLDPYDIEWAICTGNGILGLGTIPDADYAAALARAHNDWTLQRLAAPGAPLPGRDRGRPAGPAAGGGGDRAGRGAPPGGRGGDVKRQRGPLRAAPLPPHLRRRRADGAGRGHPPRDGGAQHHHAPHQRRLPRPAPGVAHQPQPQLHGPRGRASSARGSSRSTPACA